MEDSVSRVQENLAQVCERLFVSIGSLQRDAPPQSLQDEELWNVSSDTRKAMMSEKEMEESVRSMGVEIQESLDRLKDSIDALPDDDMGHDAPVLVEAIEKNVELEKRLKDAVMVAEDHVRRVECVYGSIVDSLLLSSSSSSAAAAALSSSKGKENE